MADVALALMRTLGSLEPHKVVIRNGRKFETTLDGADHEMRRTPGYVGSAFTFDADLKA